MDELTKLTDTEAEMLVIGSLLIDDVYLPDVRAIVSPEDFTDATYRQLYRAMLVLADRGVGVDVWTLLWEWEAIGGKPKPSVLAQAAGAIPTACHARHYAERVHDLAERRRMLREAQQIAGAALDISRPVSGRAKPGGVEV